ncbi:hypothetical protein SAMN05444422_10146 [Halobiforma haloterrestris]|uniref:Uncharacterized protein n=1 Tax=Natronobacterium haloterrestre TaxID=148448 RepID=A0A1I1CXX5_NATHA|nr:hypothetical protein [Halobiforma haloterrestris]SFB67501.1 hypothetical protein SAMN05444422_10146 [Halobiforma haloterrestris]
MTDRDDRENGRPASDPRWDELRADAIGIADRYRENGWDALVLEPIAADPVPNAEAEPQPDVDGVEGGPDSAPRGESQPGLEARVSREEYEPLEGLVDADDVTFGDAEVYYRPAESTGGDASDETDLEDRRFAIVVERDGESETAVCLPLAYSIGEARPVLERALVDEELLIRVRAETDEENRWVTFSHEDPSLFLEEADVRRWRNEE